MFLKRIFVVLLCGVIAGSCVIYTLTFRFFDRPLSEAKQEKFQEQIVLPDNFTLAASVNSFDTVKNTLQSARKNVSQGSYALELNVAFNAKGTPYLADGPEYITPASVKLEDIFKEFQDTDFLRYIIRLMNDTSTSSLTDLAVKYGLIGRIMLIGFSADELAESSLQYGNFKICISLDSMDVKMSDHDACLEALQAYVDEGVCAVSCKLSDVSSAFCEAISEVRQLRFVLEDVNSTYDMYHALSLNPNIVITDRPEILYDMMLSQDYLDLNQANAF